MKRKGVSDAIIWMLGTGIALCLSYLLCRYFFFNLHGMMQWPLILFVVGSAALIISAVFSARKVMVCIVVGYLGGFAIGMLFGVDGADPGGGTTNNAWMIWTVSFIVVLLVGIFLEWVRKRIKR